MRSKRPQGLLLLSLLLTVGSIASAQEPSVQGTPSLLDDFMAEDLEGRAWERSRLQGKVVLVEFWATWCIPCLGQLPGLKDAYESFHEAGFEILAVSLDRGDRRAVRSWLRRHEVPWPVLHDGRGFSGDLARHFAIDSVPRSVLFDAAGRVIAEDLDPDALQAVLGALLRSQPLEQQPEQPLAQRQAQP